MKAAVFACVVTTLVAAAAGHDWGWGKCPSAQPFPNLDVDRFLGLWHVIQQTDTTSSCLTMNYTQTSSPTQIRATKSRQLLVLDTLSIEHINAYTAKLDIPDFEKAAAMRVKWPLNLAGKADYTVLDTDYDTYAVVFECQNLMSFLHRKSAAILSRTLTLSQETISKERELLASFKIPTGDMDSIDNSVCVHREDARLNIDIDEDTIKKMLQDASDGVRNLASQLAGGANDLAASLATISRNLALRASGQEPEAIQTID